MKKRKKTFDVELEDFTDIGINIKYLRGHTSQNNLYKKDKSRHTKDLNSKTLIREKREDEKFKSKAKRKNRTDGSKE